jgi:hypothetical protein
MRTDDRTIDQAVRVTMVAGRGDRFRAARKRRVSVGTDMRIAMHLNPMPMQWASA